MKNIYHFLLSLGSFLLATTVNAQTGCLEIESILVNSCAPGLDEGKNEMLRFRVGDAPLQASDMVAGWSNTNLPWNGIVMDATTAQKTSEFNATITSCGVLIEPLDDILPAYAQVILISSYNVSTANGFFSQLGDTLYVLYANDDTNVGHYLNYLPNPNPNNQTATITFNTAGCTDAVTYQRTQLVTTIGSIGDQDGATVNFTASGTPTYVNLGCIAPYTPFSANWSVPAICASTPAFNLNAFVTGTTGGTWTGPGVTGDTLDPTGLTGSISLTYSVGVGACTDEVTQQVPIYGIVDASWTPPTVICNYAGNVDMNQYVAGTPGGTWSGPGITGSTFNPTFLFGNNTFIYSVGTGGCADTESHTILLQGLIANWVTPGVLCASSGDFNLAPLAGTSSPGSWSGPGVTGTTFNPTGLSGAIPITYTASLNGCSLPNTQTIQIDSGPDASWTNPGFVCNTSTTINLDDFITGQTGGTWTGNGVTGSTFDPSAVNASSTLTYTVLGTTCNGSVSHIVYVGSLPLLTVSGRTSYCAGDAAEPLQADTVAGASVSWYSDAALTQLVGTGSSFLPTLSAGAIWYVTQSSGTCASPVASVTLSLTPAPATPVTLSSVEVCAGAPIPLLTATATDTIRWYADLAQTILLGEGTSYQPSSADLTVYVNAQNGACQSASVPVTLSTLSLTTLTVTASGPLDLCKGTTVTLTATSNQPVNWSNGSQLAAITISEGGTYTVSASNICNTESVQTVVNNLTPDASFTLSSEQGYAPLAVAVQPVSSAGCDWSLNGAAIDLTSLQLLLETAGTYELRQLCNNSGCIDSSSREIVVINGNFVLELPNSFTPNGDGFNDFFKAKASGIVEFRSLIFDRWGQEVFQWEGAGNSWDGTNKGNAVPDGVYFYVIKGRDFTSQEFERYGSVTLLRK